MNFEEKHNNLLSGRNNNVKKGDTVICIRDKDESDLTKDKTYTVLDKNQRFGFEYYRIIDDGEHIDSFPFWNFESVPANRNRIINEILKV